MKTVVFTTLIAILAMVFFLEKSGAIGKDRILAACDFEQIGRDVVKDVSGHGNDGTLVVFSAGGRVTLRLATGHV